MNLNLNRFLTDSSLMDFRYGRQLICALISRSSTLDNDIWNIRGDGGGGVEMLVLTSGRAILTLDLRIYK